MNKEVKWLPIILFATSCLFLLPIFTYPSDWAGWLLVYFSFVLPSLFGRVRRDRKLLFILWIIIAFHNAISIYNVYGGVIYGAALDAANFQELAKDLTTGRYPLWFAEFGSLEIGASSYSRFLAISYRIFGVSLLLGQTLSVIAYTFSCIVLIYLAGSLRFRFKRAILLIYGLSAPAIIFCSVTMREAWQVLFFLLVVFFTLKLRTAPSLFKAVCISIFGLGLGMLHNGLFVYALALTGWSLYWGASGKWKNAKYKKILIRAGILATALIVSSVWIYLGGEIGGISGAIQSGEAINYTENYREKGDKDASANYYVKVDTSSPLTFISSGSLAFIYYLFAPFPWEVRRVIDIYAAVESILRLILLFFIAQLWWKSKGERRRRYSYLLICYLSLEFLWSLGTANWGTALRHHIVASGILALLGSPSLAYSLQRVLNRLKSRSPNAFQLKRYDMKSTKATN